MLQRRHKITIRKSFWGSKNEKSFLGSKNEKTFPKKSLRNRL